MPRTEKKFELTTAPETRSGRSPARFMPWPRIAVTPVTEASPRKSRKSAPVTATARASSDEVASIVTRRSAAT